MTAATVARAQQLLEALAGPEARLRGDQAAAIEAVVDDRRRALVVQRTGWGKSLTYFAAAKILRERGRGTALLISPLLALMRDQMIAAQRMGLVALSINSANVEEWEDAEAALRANAVDLLAISPERLNNPNFVERVLPDLAQRVGILILDEAHCISAWGHDFRPDYLRIRTALARLAPGTPVLATTATATDQVIADLTGQLGVKPVTLRGTLERESLALSVVALAEGAQRLAWLAANVPDLAGSGIIYTLTQAGATDTATWLRAAGVAARAYTGATEPEERLELEAALRANEVKVLVATSALGMGYDQPDLGFVVNLGAPSSITAYYQMVGRAGRALRHAEAVLLPGEEDARIWRYFDNVSFPPQDKAEAVLRVLQAAPGPVSEGVIEGRVDLRRSRLTTLLKVLDVEGAARRVRGGWISTGEAWSYDEERYARVRAARAADQGLVVAYQASTGCRMAFLRGALDDPELAADWHCGRCDNCAPRSWVQTAAPVVSAAQTAGRQHPVVLEARKMWPSGVDDVRGRIAHSRRAADGRALSLAGTVGWDRAVRAALDDPAAAIHPDVVDGIVGVLGRWGWPEGRPTWVTWIPSTRRPGLSRAIAERIGTIGKLPVLDAISRVRAAPAQAEMGNSAYSWANVWAAFALVGGAELMGPVLVVDDIWASGWTMTVVAELLAGAGHFPVYPFALQKGR